MINISSNDNLNKFKWYINGYREDNLYICNILNNAGNNTFYLDDIVSTYKNKVFEFNEELEKKGIEYFSSDYYTRYIIKIYFDILLLNGIKEVNWLMKHLNEVGYVSKYIPFLSKVTFGKLVQKYNKICDNIKNFDFRNNKDVVCNFFTNNLLFDGFMPGSVIHFWEKVKKELEELGVLFTQEELDFINNEVLNREFEAVERYQNLGEDAIITFKEKCYELGLELQCDEEIFKNDINYKRILKK